MGRGMSPVADTPGTALARRVDWAGERVHTPSRIPQRRKERGSEEEGGSHPGTHEATLPSTQTKSRTCHLDIRKYAPVLRMSPYATTLRHNSTTANRQHHPSQTRVRIEPFCFIVTPPYKQHSGWFETSGEERRGDAPKKMPRAS